MRSLTSCSMIWQYLIHFYHFFDNAIIQNLQNKNSQNLLHVRMEREFQKTLTKRILIRSL